MGDATNEEIRYTQFLLQVNLLPVKLGFVTDPELPSNEVTTFISPLDVGTWSCLGFSITAIAGFLTVLANTKDGWTGFVATVTLKAFVVTSILLGQVGDSTRKVYRAKKVVIVLLIFWFCGNLLLMANLYQGSIYSCLAVPFPPKTPSGVMDLVHWDIPVVAMDVLYNGESKSVHSYLIDFSIPELLKDNGLSPQFRDFLEKLQPKLLSWSASRGTNGVKNSDRKLNEIASNNGNID